GGASRMKRQLGDDGVTRLKSWVSDGGALIGFAGAGMLLADKDVGLTSIAALGADSTAKPDTTVPGKEPPVLSPTSPSKDKPEWLPGSIFRATLDPTHWLTLGYESDRLPVYVEGSTFWKLSKNGANPVAFVGDSLALSGFTWPGNTERLLKGTAWAGLEGLRPPMDRITSPLRTGRLESPGALTTRTPSFVPKYSPRSGFRFTSSRSPQGDPNENSKPCIPGIPGAIWKVGIGTSGISIRNEPPRSSATSATFFVSPPRRYSTCTVSPGSSLRA